MAEVRFGTYNVLNFGQEDSPRERERVGRVIEVIGGLGADVVAVQEIVAADETAAGELLAKLASDVGMRSEVEPGRHAVAIGHKLSHRDLSFHVGLMWRPEIDPVPGSFHAYGTGDFWHGLAKVTLDVGGVRIAHASFHATPFGRRMRADQSERVVSCMTRPDGRPPGLIGGDWNAVGADRNPDGTYYDPDPYEGGWHDDLIYQCTWEYDGHGRRRHRADRTPSDVLYAGGLRDAAAVLQAPWEPTVGHWPVGDPFGRRRIDAIRVTAELVPALRGVRVHRSEPALAASDHLPVVVSYDPAVAS